MDMHSPTLKLPGEAASQVPPQPTAAAAPLALPKPTTRRFLLLAGAGILTVTAVALTGAWLAAGPAALEAPKVAEGPFAAARLEAAPPLPVPAPATPAMLEAPSPAAAPSPAPPAPTLPEVRPPAPPEPDPLAEHRKLLEQASAPIPAPVPVAAAPEVEKLSAMMTQVSAMLAESLRGQVELRNRVGEIERRQATLTLDQNRRLTYLEAQAAVTAAGAAAAPAPVPAPQPPQAPTRAAAPRAGSSTTTWRITGAAHSLVYLVAINPAPGDPAAITAKLGDAVPGYGRVSRIEQRGATWVVVTERGEITSN